MATCVPTIQVLSKQNYEEQHVVTLVHSPLPPLLPSSLRIQSSILSLTTNNFTYARLGHLIGSWWDIYPLPSSIPSEFSDPAKYGCIAAWGYGVVLESTISDSSIQVGSHVFGYFPIGTLPIDLEVQVSDTIPGQFTEVSTRRSKTMPIYNRYTTLLSPTLHPAKNNDRRESEAFDALFYVLFETGYLMNRFLFAWEPSERSHPSAEPGTPGADIIGDHSIDSDTIIILFAASGKTALSFAQQLKYARPAMKQPQSVIAVGSKTTQLFTQDTGLFDTVLTYDQAGQDLEAKIGSSSKNRIFVIDFGARDEAADRWAKKLQASSKQVTIYSVGGECSADGPDILLQKLIKLSQTERVQVMASGIKSKAHLILGEKGYSNQFLEAWETFKKAGGIQGLKVVLGEGINGFAKGWEKLSSGNVGPDEGLVFDLSSALPGRKV